MSNDVLDIAERTWRRLGVPAGTRDELRAELGADLAEAAADGRSALDYVGGDPAGLARTWAAERGVVRPRPLLARTTAAGVLAMVPGAAFGLLLVVAPSSMFLNDLLLGGSRQMVEPADDGSVSIIYAVDPPAWLVLLWYVTAAAFAYGGALAAVSGTLRAFGDVGRRATVRALTGMLPVAAVLATVAGVTVAGAGGYAASGRLLLAICGSVLAVVATVVAATRLAVVLRARPAAAHPAEPVPTA